MVPVWHDGVRTISICASIKTGLPVCWESGGGGLGIRGGGAGNQGGGLDSSSVAAQTAPVKQHWAEG